MRASTSFGAAYGGFPKLGGSTLGIPMIRITIFLGVKWGPPISGNYHKREGAGTVVV